MCLQLQLGSPHSLGFVVQFSLCGSASDLVLFFTRPWHVAMSVYAPAQASDHSQHKHPGRPPCSLASQPHSAPAVPGNHESRPRWRWWRALRVECTSPRDLHGSPSHHPSLMSLFRIFLPQAKQPFLSPLLVSPSSMTFII